MSHRSCNILVTGAASGIGRGLALYLAERGHSIFATDLNLEMTQETIKLMAASAGASSAHSLDVTSDASVAEFMRAIEHRPVDVLVNNAGVQNVARLEDFPQDRWEKLIEIMVNGPARLTRAVLPGMRHQKYGRIINIGSIHSLVASPGKSAYVAAKHALVGFSKAIALENADVDITINTICPSYLRTPLVDGQIATLAKLHNLTESEVIHRIMLAPMPKKAFVTIEEVGATAEFLISHAARNITGQTITIDGGWTAQ